MAGEGTLAEALRSLAHRLLEDLGAEAAILSRVLGDVLIIVTQVPGQEQLSQGQGYLVSDFPLTRQVLRTGEPAILTVDDADVDPAEAELLRELGYATLLMLPLELHGERWGLVEVYRTDVRRFESADVTRARELARLR